MYNNISILGYAAKDAAKISENIIALTIATNESYKNKADEWVELTEFHTVFFRGTQMLKVGKVKTGDMLHIAGRQKSYINKEDVKVPFISPSYFQIVSLKVDRPIKEKKEVVNETDKSNFEDSLPF